MKEHAIPQDITGYKFHIVGNMTLKQFAEIALGFVVAFFIYKTNLIAPIKWGLILFSAGFGAAMAFLPIEERPLDHWLTTFFMILYKPTKFYWKKHSKIPEAFTYTSTDLMKTQINETDLSPQRRERITEYLQSVKNQVTNDAFEVESLTRSNQVLSIFNDQTLKIDLTRAEKIMKRPKLKVEVRSLANIEEKTASAEITTTTTPIVQEVVFQDERPAVDSTPIKTYEPLARKMISSDQVAQEIEIPEIEKISVERKHLDEQSSEIQAMALNEQISHEKMSYQDSVTTKIENQNTNQPTDRAIQNKDLPFPIKPTKPNKLVGMVLTQENDLVNQATISLRDSQNTPVTAVKSNALGQFFVSSQLPNGVYTIEVSKEDNTFKPVKITLEGKIVDPIEIRSNE